MKCSLYIPCYCFICTTKSANFIFINFIFIIFFLGIYINSIHGIVPVVIDRSQDIVSMNSVLYILFWENKVVERVANLSLNVDDFAKKSGFVPN